MMLTIECHSLSPCSSKVFVANERNNLNLLVQMDLIFLKINHMEKDKYVTANDFYPVNRSMLYGVCMQGFTFPSTRFHYLSFLDGSSYSHSYDDNFSIPTMGGQSAQANKYDIIFLDVFPDWVQLLNNLIFWSLLRDGHEQVRRHRRVAKFT